MKYLSTATYFFISIRLVETAVQKILTLGFCRSYYGEKLRDLLKDTLQNTILGPWGGKPFPIIFLIANCQKFCLTLEKWIDIRGNSYVKTLMQVSKGKLSKLGTKNKEEPTFSSTEPSLRKILF